MHLRDYSCFVDELDVAGLEARFKHVVTNHVQLQTARLPETVHNFEELQHEIVLFEVVAALE